MKTKAIRKSRSETGSVLVYFVFVLLVVSAMASVFALTVNTVSVSHRRTDMICATQLAEGGAAMACTEMERAFTNRAAKFAANLVANPTGAYTQNPTLSTVYQKVYERVITAPFTGGQSVKAQIWFTNSSSPSSAKVVGIAKVGKVTQSATVHLEMQFGYGAAILSDSPGNSSKTVSKDRASGNVVIWGTKSGTTIIDGGMGWAILANGRANIDSYAIVPPLSVSMTNFGTADQIPDYTLPGSVDQLFDFNRFIAVADLTPGQSKSNNNHFTTFSNFLAVVSNNPSGKFLEGVIVVDIKQADFTKYSSGLTPALLGNKPVNVHGTLLFNFAADVAATDYFMDSATVNINPANLTGINATNPATFTTGYPPVYVDPSKNPVKIDITSKGFANFIGEDDLPALMYNIGIFDIHGPANVSGAIYTPSYIEIENLSANTMQYFRGILISGGGVLVDNHWASGSKNIVSYDQGAVDLLATSSNKGKRVSPIFWE